MKNMPEDNHATIKSIENEGVDQDIQKINDTKKENSTDILRTKCSAILS